jgi:TonB family protein
MSEPWRGWEGRVVNGEFPLQRLLSGSDHSAVFLTQHGEGEERRAAIKFLRLDANQAEEQLSRWKLASQLQHPGLIRIFDMGRSKLDDTELLYLVMEFADEDLSQILPQRALTPQETQEMLGRVLEVLAYVHGKGLAHGSIKPENIMAVADQVKISSDSLGAARRAGANRISRYDAPEAAAGTISPAADVWSLGMTLVEALTQRLPTPDPLRPGAVVLPTKMPEPFASIARHCLEADPQQRWTVADIAARLASSQVETQATGIATPATQSEKKLSSGWRYLVAAAAAVLVAVVWISGSKTKTSNAENRPAQVESSAKTQPAQESQEPAVTAGATPVAPVPRSTTRKSKVTPALKVTTAPAGVIPGVVHSIIPTVPPKARSTIQGRVKVRVRVQVDTSGNVASAALDSPGPSKYFAHLALDAARDWKFAPAQSQGQFVASEWTLGFAFSRSGTEVLPKQSNP